MSESLVTAAGATTFGAAMTAALLALEASGLSDRWQLLIGMAGATPVSIGLAIFAGHVACRVGGGRE